MKTKMPGQQLPTAQPGKIVGTDRPVDSSLPASSPQQIVAKLKAALAETSALPSLELLPAKSRGALLDCFGLTQELAEYYRDQARALLASDPWCHPTLETG